MAIVQCSKCGGKVSTKAEACPHCGSPVEPQQSQITCLDCGEDFEASLTACPACGGPVVAHSSPTSSELEIVEVYFPAGPSVVVGTVVLGPLKEKGTKKNGEWHGPYESYYYTGQLERKGTYKDGIADGPFEDYHPSGQLREKTEYKDGEWHGPYEKWSDGGISLAKGTHNMGTRCGEWEHRRSKWFGGYDTETALYPPCPDTED